MMLLGTQEAGEARTAASLYLHARAEYDRDALAELLIAAVTQIARIQQRAAGQFELLDRVRPRGPVPAPGYPAGDGTVVALLPGQVGILLDQPPDPRSPDSRYTTMYAAPAAHCLEPTGEQAAFTAADLTLLTTILTPASASALHAAIRQAAPPQPQARGPEPG
jgi:hypothetical protein